MTDPLSLRAMAERDLARAMCEEILREIGTRRRTADLPAFWIFDYCAKVAQSSWANEKAETERLRDAYKDEVRALRDEKAEMERQLAAKTIALDEAFAAIERSRKPYLSASGTDMYCAACKQWLGDGQRILWNQTTNQLFCMGCERHASLPLAAKGE